MLGFGVAWACSDCLCAVTTAARACVQLPSCVQRRAFPVVPHHLWLSIHSLYPPFTVSPEPWEEGLQMKIILKGRLYKTVGTKTSHTSIT